MFLKQSHRVVQSFLAVFFSLLTLTYISGCGDSTATWRQTEPLTARMLVSPNALVGPGPSGFSWSPVGSKLIYTEPLDGDDVLWLYNAVTGSKRILLDPSGKPDNIDLSSALWSPQGDVLLLAGDTSLWLLDSTSGSLKSIAGGGNLKTGLMFIPDGTYISYVQENDIYLVRASDCQIQRLTTDGSQDVFNGCLDWVYNEELATRADQPAYAWSPDGKWLVYLRLDDSAVENHPVTNYDTVPPTVSYTRYPVAGSQNPKASLYVISMESGMSKQMIPLPEDTEYILPFFTWTPDSQEAIYITVNRDHTLLKLNAWNPSSGSGRTVLSEADNNWINEDRYAAPIFIGDGQQFLWLSERDGYMHLYLYTRQGDLVRQLTKGNWMIDTNTWNLITPGRPVHVDPSGSRAYFISTKNSPLERRLYELEIATGRLDLLSQQGFHSFSLSGDGKYLVDQFSDVLTPPATMIVNSDGRGSQLLAQCAGPALTLPRITREFVTLKAHNGVDLYAQIVKPENFNPARKYPVVIHWYGGPGLQMVSNRYGTTNIFNIIERDVLYTQEGFIVWRLDNRGSFGRGHAFETPITGQLGPAALDDQLSGVEYLQSLPYIDATRIGADGKSFGGFLTLYALIYAPETFRCGVDVAGPTNWAYYDTIYTERYMRTPSQNPSGYAATDLIAAAAWIKAEPLLIHGLSDTNVHLQNTVNFIEALEAADKPFYFLPLPNTNHSIMGDSLVATLSASIDYFSLCLAPEKIRE